VHKGMKSIFAEGMLALWKVLALESDTVERYRGLADEVNLRINWVSEVVCLVGIGGLGRGWCYRGLKRRKISSWTYKD